MHDPTKHHFWAIKWILWYVVGTTDFGIWYSRKLVFRLFGFTDSDWAGYQDDRKSTSGYIFSLGSDFLSWSSNNQEIVVLSSSNAEYIAATA